MMYDETDTTFQRQQFQMFSDVVDDHSYAICQEWVTDLNTGSESLAFRINGHTYAAHSLFPLFGNKLLVSRSDFEDIVRSVKEQCKEASIQLQ
jgi:hypothetical protein